jgi:hypothetical protein
MKRKVTPINVNANQGFFIDDNNRIVAAFNNENKVVIIPIPYTANDIKLPVNYRDYVVKQRITDCFHIQMWTINDQFESF